MKPLADVLAFDARLGSDGAPRERADSPARAVFG